MREPARLSETMMGGKACRLCGSRFSSSDAAFCPFDGEPLASETEAPRPRDPLLDTVIDARYEVEAILGEGGMGIVYRVTHRVLGKAFALKVLRGELSRETELGIRFLREAQAAASVSHPNVIQITDFGTLPSGQSYFVMELLTGTSLSRIVRRGGPLPAARAVRLLRQIVDGLAAAHRAGVVHRDLKPDNVFVGKDADGEEVVKVLDFGLARIAGQSRLTKEGLVFGTPHYMSPEQASGGTVDQRTDIYALGVVMYEMFTGRVPFEADTFMGVLTKHLYMEPTPPSVVLGGTRELGALEQLTLRCLEKKPERRFSTVGALSAELARIVTWGEDGALHVAPVRPGERREAHALADELELPGAEEVELARRRRRGRFPHIHVHVAPWQAAVAFFAMVIVGGLAYLLGRPAPRGGGAGTSENGAGAPADARGTPGGVAGPGRPSELEPRASPPRARSATGDGDSDDEGPPRRAEAGQLPPAPAAAPSAPAVRRAVASPSKRRQPAPSSPVSSAGSPSKVSTAKEKMVGTDIVDPWSE